MDEIIYKKGITGGQITLPPSKSVAHRAMICASLCMGKSTIYNIDNSKDMQATMAFVSAIGKTYNYQNKTLSINRGKKPNFAELDCIESGSTLRFVIPIMAALGIKTKFTGQGRLPQRPIGVYTQILKGVKTKGDGLPFYIEGQLESGDFEIRGDISSQFITGLLFALPLLKGDSKIILTTQLQSKSYVDITIDILKEFGVLVDETDYGYHIKGNQQYLAKDYTVEGDWSQAAFFIAMGANSPNPVVLNGLNIESKQGDKKCLEVFGKMNVPIKFENNQLIISKTLEKAKAIEIDVGDIPDMVPALASLMAVANGTSTITNAKRLRIKESDRLKAVSELINTLGGNVTELEDGLVIKGVDKLNFGLVNGCNDHRIVMATSALVSSCSGEITVTDKNSINKSYPDFYKDFISLGGEIDGINMG